MDFSSDIQIVNLELFDAAFLVTPGDEEGVKRRFMTLFVSEADERRGGSAAVFKATNAQGETFALKRLRVKPRDAVEGGSISLPSQASRESRASRKVLRNSFASSGGSAPSRSGTPDYVTSGHIAAFYEEYRIHLAVSNLRGFPKLFGFGFAGGDPVIVMEWVEGLTLRDAVRTRAHVQAQSAELPLASVADIGIAVLNLLARAAELDSRFVHRDISPRNIMFRTDQRSLDEQLASGNLDICLVDFGSAALPPSATSPTFTMQANTWRMGTPAYAPPEMLSADVELPPGYRQSPAIDVYALCSVLYELYSGRKPFRIDSETGVSPYRLKTETQPDELQPREPDGGALAGIIMTGLSAQQEDRPAVVQLKTALENWKQFPGRRRIGSLAGAARVERSMWQPDYARRAVTRRAFAVAAIVAVGAVAAGVIVATKKPNRAQAVDSARYATADAPYSGEPLFKALDRGSASWMLCTAAGDIACKPASSRECGAMREGLAALYDDASGMYGYVVPADNAGFAWAILPAFAQASDFSEGLAAAQDVQTKLWGYIDAKGSWAIRPQYRAGGAFSNGVAAVSFSQGGAPDAGASWGAIGADGSMAIPPRFPALGSRSAEGFAVAEAEPGSWGVVDAEDEWTSERRFTLMRRFANGCAPALDADAEGGLWGYVDERGEWVIEPRFQDARPFSEEQASVQDPESKLWYFIGKDGLAAGGMKPRFWKLGDLHDGLAPAQASAEDNVVIFDESDPDARSEYAGKRYGYVDASGEWQMKRLTNLVDTAIGTPGT